MTFSRLFPTFFTEYWINLGQSAAFQGKPLIDCLSRIHDDITKVWNFHDPNQVRFLPDSEPQTERDDWLSQYSDVMTLASAIGTVVAQALGGLGIAILALKFLYRTYRAVEPTARYMGVFIIDLTVILYRIFETTPVTKELIDET
ncbi:hypothetical protein BDQ17DRAFT_1366357, partial [Cyathus striatus]